MNTAPPVFSTAIQSYRDAFAAIMAMPFVAGVAFAASLGQGIIEFALLPTVSAERSLFDEIIALFLGAVWSFLFAPFLIAVHRFVVLGEVTDRYRIEPGNPRFLRFFQWSFALFAIFSAVTIVSTITGENAIGAVIAFAGAVAALFIGLRVVILFPAIAVDAPNATFHNAFADTRGHILRILALMFVTALPALIGAIFTAVFLVGASIEGTPRFGIPAALLFAASSVFFGAVFVAVASRLYQALGERVN